LRSWALELLKCLACGGSPLLHAEGGVQCPRCPARYSLRDDIVSFLGEPNPVVLREREAVRKLDGGSLEASGRLALLLERMDTALLSEEEASEYPCLQHARECRAQIQELLETQPIPPGVLVELGADHCWASGLFIDAGCRVVAVDITDHLQLAPRARDPALCRIKADMNVLPLRDGSVDIVWATAAAHHSWDLGRTFREAARVLRPGGRLFFCCEPMPSWLRYPFGKDFGHDEKALGINETWNPRAVWLRQCARAGLRPRLAFPRLDPRTIRQRLRARHLPELLFPLVRPFLRALQVSIHLVASK
jgi:SAM-dependent methyltransferase